MTNDSDKTARRPGPQTPEEHKDSQEFGENLVDAAMGNGEYEAVLGYVLGMLDNGLDARAAYERG